MLGLDPSIPGRKGALSGKRFPGLRRAPPENGVTAARGFEKPYPHIFSVTGSASVGR